MARLSQSEFHRTAGLAGLALIAAAGCAIAPPQADAGADIRDAVGLEQAVTFRLEGGLLDEPLGESHLSEAQAVRSAVETSPELQAALARVRVAEKDADLAGRLPNPVLDLVLREPSDGGSTQVEASLSASLLGLLQRPQRASTAAHRLQAEAASALSAALDLVAGVQSAYAECQVLEELAAVLEQRLGALDRLVEVARVRLELGAASQHEVLTAQAQATELSVELERRRQDVRQARLALARRIGEPSGAADWTLDTWSAPGGAPTSESACVEAALASRPELVALEWEVRAREDEERMATGMPWDGASLGVDAEEDDEDDDWSVGPSLATPLPIFDTPSGRRERAEAHTAEARHRLAEARRAIVAEVRSALAALQSAQSSLARVESELISSQERRRSEVEQAHRAGQVDLTTLLLAEEALGRARASRLELARAVSTALHALQRAVGGPVRYHTLSVTPVAQPSPERSRP